MSWTTVCDLPMEAFQGGRTLDTTDFQNHAHIAGSVATGSGYVCFQGNDARLEVPVRDESLARFAGLRVHVWVRPGAIAHRFNLVEGWMSFALFIESDGRLMGTVYDGQQWNGVDSGTSKVAPNRWTAVSFRYDGASIARLEIDGALVGSRLDMPHRLGQPQQVIALGHWPRGDARYTLQGDLGHVRIERRDYEDVWRDTIAIGLCGRRLTPEQVDARHELDYLISTLGEKERERLRECAVRQAESMREFVRDVRGTNPREVARKRSAARSLRKSWCGSPELPALRAELKDYLVSIAGTPDTPERARFLEWVERLLDIGNQCAFEGPPYDRIRELSRILFPELGSFEDDLRNLIGSI